LDEIESIITADRVKDLGEQMPVATIAKVISQFEHNKPRCNDWSISAI